VEGGTFSTQLPVSSKRPFKHLCATELYFRPATGPVLNLTWGFSWAVRDLNPRPLACHAPATVPQSHIHPHLPAILLPVGDRVMPMGESNLPQNLPH
jgi:hypothetical protein